MRCAFSICMRTANSELAVRRDCVGEGGNGLGGRCASAETLVSVPASVESAADPDRSLCSRRLVGLIREHVSPDDVAEAARRHAVDGGIACRALTQVPVSLDEHRACRLWFARFGEDAERAFIRPCEQIHGDLIASDCAPGTIAPTYELLENPRGFELQPAFWHFAGSADYNDDGRPDLVWHATAADAGADLGQVELWLSRSDGRASAG
jgi:hypothetical protein